MFQFKKENAVFTNVIYLNFYISEQYRIAATSQEENSNRHCRQTWNYNNIYFEPPSYPHFLSFFLLVIPFTSVYSRKNEGGTFVPALRASSAGRHRDVQCSRPLSSKMLSLCGGARWTKSCKPRATRICISVSGFARIRLQ